MRSILQGCAPCDVPRIEVRPQSHQHVYGVQEAAAWENSISGVASTSSGRVYIDIQWLMMVRRADATAATLLHEQVSRDLQGRILCAVVLVA